MKELKKLMILGTCCCMCLVVAQSALADFVGVYTANKEGPEVQVCSDGVAPGLPGPLTVCNVFVDFDQANDRLLRHPDITILLEVLKQVGAILTAKRRNPIINPRHSPGQ